MSKRKKHITLLKSKFLQQKILFKNVKLPFYYRFDGPVEFLEKAADLKLSGLEKEYEAYMDSIIEFEIDLSIGGLYDLDITADKIEEMDEEELSEYIFEYIPEARVFGYFGEDQHTRVIIDNSQNHTNYTIETETFDSENYLLEEDSIICRASSCEVFKITDEEDIEEFRDILSVIEHNNIVLKSKLK